jgi:hypothetical protein
VKVEASIDRPTGSKEGERYWIQRDAKGWRDVDECVGSLPFNGFATWSGSTDGKNLNAKGAKEEDAKDAKDFPLRPLRLIHS